MADKFKEMDVVSKFDIERSNQIERETQLIKSKMQQIIAKFQDQTEREKRNKTKAFWLERKKQLEEDDKLINEMLVELNGGLSR